MDRDTGLSRTTAITGALVVASLGGTLAIGLVARGAESTGTTPATDEATTDTEGESGGGSAGAPSLSPGGDGTGQATSGGS